jgi:hypothetical protein
MQPRDRAPDERPALRAPSVDERRDGRERTRDERRDEGRDDRRGDGRERRDDMRDRRDDLRDRRSDAGPEPRLQRLDDLREGRREETENGRTIIREPGGRTIIRESGGRTIIRREEAGRFRLGRARFELSDAAQRP